MKTPEEMAEEYVAHNRSYPYDSLNAQDRYMRNSYLVGYQAAKPQWISVKERLPQINQGFIGFVQNQEVCNSHRYANCTKDDSPVFYVNTKTGLLICGLESVSHWMPLPEPPRE